MFSFAFETFRFLGVIIFVEAEKIKQNNTNLCSFRCCVFCFSVFETSGFVAVLNNAGADKTEEDRTN